MVLTSGVFQPADGIGQQPHTAQKASPLLLVNFLVVPHADSYRIRFPDISENNIQTHLETQVRVRKPCRLHLLDWRYRKSPRKVRLVWSSTVTGSQYAHSCLRQKGLSGAKCPCRQPHNNHLVRKIVSVLTVTQNCGMILTFLLISIIQNIDLQLGTGYLQKQRSSWWKI